MKLKYRSNNSGGGWWLTDDDWRAMEAAGWTVEWYAAQTQPWGNNKPYPEGRWLGALATRATIAVDSMDDAKRRIREWEELSGSNAADEGCNCCGRPHGFGVEDDAGNWIDDPVELVEYEPTWE